jgi:allantoicase
MGYQVSPEASTASLPASHQLTDIPHVEALPLTYEAFLPFGRVNQAFSVPTAAPRGIAKTPANQGTACKYHKMALLEDKFEKKEDRKTTIGVIRSQPRVATGSEVDITVLERHPKTNQAFVPLGQSTGSGTAVGGSKTGKGSYVVMAALPKENNGEPDLSTLRVFTVPSSQGISFNAGIWHNPLMTADEQMDFACIESFDAQTDKVDTDFYRRDGAAFARFTLPKSDFSVSASGVSAVVQAGKETASTTFASLKSMLPTLSSSSGNIPCSPLTPEAFADFGYVVQGYDSAASAPSYARVAVSEEFKNVKCMDLSSFEETYPAEAGATSNISVFRSTPKEGLEKGKPWPVKLIERYAYPLLMWRPRADMFHRHPYTSQTFLPMGLTTVSY